MKKISILCICVILFSATFLSAEEEIRLYDSPVNPQTYLIRPGDKLLVTFTNSKINSMTLEIDPEGRIVDETIGMIDFQYKTLMYAKTTLTEKLKQLYNVQGIEISISAPREVSIAVYGSVRYPGIYKGLTSDRVSSIITKAGGTIKSGSTRNVSFIAGDNKIIVDLDKAKYNGDINSNPYLYSGIEIEVPSKSSQTVHVSGDVNFPREIELKDGDDLTTIIQLAGSFKNLAKMSDVQIIRGNKKIENNKIEAGDIIVINSSTQNAKQHIKIFGAVANQGLYSFTSGISLDELLAKAGGLTEKANKKLVTVFRQPIFDSHGNKSEIRYPISLPIQTKEKSTLQLEINDSIFVPWQVGFVKVSGAVLNPGYFPYQNNNDILYYINSAGGFLPTSNKDEIRIFNPISENTIIVSSAVEVPDGAEIIVQIKEELK